MMPFNTVQFNIFLKLHRKDKCVGHKRNIEFAAYLFNYMLFSVRSISHIECRWQILFLKLLDLLVHCWIRAYSSETHSVSAGISRAWTGYLMPSNAWEGHRFYQGLLSFWQMILPSPVPWIHKAESITHGAIQYVEGGDKQWLLSCCSCSEDCRVQIKVINLNKQDRRPPQWG